ncbi:1-deoxy-D-xylulose-5-phosphate reductoisomerase [Pueribacillus theae]|uniref:1-deoxy-D-xylulose 5-phosphate reductoisomerase n=1 Tax=Pueribacillus theae TaxID=2171751 RepID=A0A2U1K7P1_9BACI|nr:1-deoxy-D-xylulose-5-phosphate reductoisomerase [Pueribacillus theae]PWA13536.1 1-deoxy-D-xylulose-5-phosphate reductoisomerase [Pueribacillus theae]
MKKISLLGATGSIGTQTLDVIRANQDSMKLVAMSIGQNIGLGEQMIREFKPKLVSVLSKDARDELFPVLPPETKVVFGEEGLIEVATHPDANLLLNSVVGSVGLKPTLAAIECSKTIAIANKETLVTAGHIVMKAAAEKGVSILPVDSEHSAIFQCLNGEKKSEIAKIILTASGGSFRDKMRDELKNVTVAEALDHPNWSMGAKLTVDSATMMNKGLEVIEAHWLFQLPYSQIDVILHRESVIHSMVEFKDTSVIAQLGTPDMKIPIQYALTYPDRLELPRTKRLNLSEIGSLHFAEIDYERYRCLKMAFQAGKIGGTMPAVLNAANEEAVAAFLSNHISFLEIETLVEKAMERHVTINDPPLEAILDADNETRNAVKKLIQ